MKSHTISPNYSYNKPKKKKSFIKIFFKRIFILFCAWCIGGFIWFQVKIKSNLPDINQIKDVAFSQATLITDRNGKELYRLFSENREYVEYSGISENMINAIVAIEDQRYWEHDGVDSIWIIRAVISKVLHPNSKLQWASTLSQQLVKNLLLSNERSVIRKLKEITLTKQLDGVLDDMVKESRWKLNWEALKRAKKELTLELYLNKVEFSNNAFGVEAAAQTYFDKHASQLNVLESAILASIPKSASVYNPYSHRAATIGNLSITDSEWTTYSVLSDEALHTAVMDKIKSIMDKADFKNKTDYNAFSKYLNWLIDFSINVDGTKYDVKYSAWRKDVVLLRMYADEYIDEEQLVKSLIDGFDIELKSAWFEIKAPHFVMWIIKLLQEQYDEDTLKNKWLVVTTSLDMDIQEIAEQSLVWNKSALEVYGASNEAMVYLDSTNWDVLAYVWSYDYFDEEIEWQNDMLQSPRQVWSSIKPLIYALGFMTLPLTEDTPIYDIPFSIGWMRPNDSDGKFLWIMPLKNALAYSRNIPAAKMIQAVWWQDVALPFLRKIWMKSLSETWDYWYPLALWAWEIPVIELAAAYMHLSNPTPGTINPILSIKTSDGSLIYEKQNEVQEETIPAWVWYVMWDILSTPGNMPSNWVWAYTVHGLKLWLKTGTSNMKTPKWDRARDGLLATYTPTRVAVFRWWNADGSPMYQNAYGWFLNAEAMRDFWSTLLKNNYISNEWMTAVDVWTVSISKLSGKLAWDGTPSEYVVSSMWYAATLPSEVDGWATPVEYDASCNGLASPLTAASDLKHGYVFTPTTFMPWDYDLDEIKTYWQWASSGALFGESGFSGKVTFTYPNLLIEMPQDYCEWMTPEISEDIQISINNLKAWQKISNKPMVWFSVKSKNWIKRVTVSINDKVIWSVDYNWKSTDLTDVISSNLWDVSWAWELVLTAMDKEWFANRVSMNVSIVKADTVAPTVMKDKTYVVKDWNKYRVVIVINDDLSGVEWGTVSQDGKTINTFKKNYAEFYMTTPWVVSISAKDSYGNQLNDTLDIRNYIEWYQEPQAETQPQQEETPAANPETWNETAPSESQSEEAAG